MINVTFYTHPQVGKQVKTDDKYILLYYYLSDRRSMVFLQESIGVLESIRKEEKTFEEIYTFNTVDISWSAGEFECDKDTAYFISNHPDKEPSFDIPLQELIDILKEWEAFLSN